MGAGDIVGLAPDGADLNGFAAVETDAFVKNATAHGLFLHVVIVAFYKGSLLVALFFGQRVDVFLADGVESLDAPVLVGGTCLGHGVGLVVALVVHVLAEVFVVYFVAIFALNGCASHFGKFHLGLALLLDGLVGSLEGAEKVGFGNFAHLAFDHHDVVVGGAYHEFHVGTLELLEVGVDDIFAVDAGHADLRDGAVEGDVADRDCG